MRRPVPTRTRALAAGVLVLAVAGGGVALATSRAGGGAAAPAPVPAPATGRVSSPAAAAPSTPRPPARPAPATDPLTGGRPDDGPVVAVKVENIAAARPQVGLGVADVVVAEQVEGAQTRLVAVYHTRFPSRLGPVRSARSTDVQLLPLFGRPGLVYSGANRKVQAKIDRASVVPIARSTRDHRRVAPHNVFVDLAAIARAEKKVGRARSIGWTFAERSAQASAAPARAGRAAGWATTRSASTGPAAATPSAGTAGPTPTATPAGPPAATTWW